jgi:hypothetical protein
MINEDTFTQQAKEEVLKLSTTDMQDFLQALANQQHKLCPIKTSKDDTILDLVHREDKLIWIKKTNYTMLLNLPNIQQDKEKLTKILTDGMVKHTCSQKLMSFLVINKNISVEYKFNDLNMNLVDDIIINKQSCTKWQKNNKTYTFVNNMFELFGH